MASILIIGAVALDRPVWLNVLLRSGGRMHGRSLDGGFCGRLGGGAANAGCALRAAGHQVSVATILAEDADGRRARLLAEEAGLDLRLAHMRAGTSRQTLVLIEPSGERTILDLDATPSNVSGLETPKPDAHPEFRPDGLFVRGAYGGASNWASATRGPVLLHWPAAAYAGEADVIVASTEDLPAGGEENLLAAAAARLGPRLRWAVVTRGAKGAVAYGPGGPIAVQPPAATMRDATGAGDVFAAGLLDALLAGADMTRALGHACTWGAATVGLESSAPVDAPAGTFRPFT